MGFDAPRLLAVGPVDLPDWPTLVRAADWPAAASAMKAGAVGGARIDLVLIAPRLGDGTDAWPFVAALRAARPWQAWALVAPGGELTPACEARARRLGAAGVFEATASFDDLLDLAARRRAAQLAADVAEIEADWGRRSRRRLAPLQPDIGGGANPALAG